MSQPVYRVFIAGMGKRGIHHARAFSENPRFEIVGLSDIDPARLETAAKEFEVPETGTDALAAASRVKPDLFCFATPPRIRIDLVRAGIESGAKLIACEKPMAMNLSEASQIRRITREAGVKLVVSHQHRYGEHYRRVKEIIAGGEIGRVHTVYGHSVGYMMHLLTHLIDYMRWFNDGAEVQWVMAQAAGRGKLASDHPSPDHLAGFIHFANGVRGIVETGGGSPDVPEVPYWWRKNRVGAQGTEGFAEVLTGGGWRAVTPKGVQSGPGDMDYARDMAPYVAQMAEWLDDDNRPHPCGGEVAFRGMEIAMALCRSVVDRGQVALPLPEGQPEMERLASVIPDRPVILTMAESLTEYPDGLVP